MSVTACGVCAPTGSSTAGTTSRSPRIPPCAFHEITQAVDDVSPGEAEERHWECAVLESLLVRSADGEGPRSEEQTYEAFDAKKRKKRLVIADALDRLDGAGLIECRGGRSIPSEVARRLNELMTL